MTSAFFRDCADCPEMVIVPAGRFTMGAPASEEGSDDGERPQHLVTVKSFALGRSEVTVADFERFVKASGYRSDAERNTRVRGFGDGCYTYISRPSGWEAGRSWHDPGFKQGAANPAVCVSWNDAQAYAAWLSKRTGRIYRLLSEAEWEYAARAGTTTSRYWGEDPNHACKFANVADRALAVKGPLFSQSGEAATIHDCDDRHAETAPVGSFRPNAFGLYDMLGNVWEWTQDCGINRYADAPRDGSAWLRIQLCLSEVPRRLLARRSRRRAGGRTQRVRSRVPELPPGFPPCQDD
ncbi:MAG: formylglycine-generating enzyme family protein [Candidatus Accumulibacter sp.]|uniref:Formylglycine-generating enzyme family protein n=1 Tax=Candidatus Accumulibacter proximus TaxID=2954385 RepID=A0A935Q0L6_9PROT|nr:formylglycine-generating enzyme family protein [Candidatus Accumulibacter proximus]